MVLSKPGNGIKKTAQYHQFPHRCRLPTGHDQAVDIGKMIDGSNLTSMMAKILDSLTMHVKVALQGQEADGTRSGQ